MPLYFDKATAINKNIPVLNPPRFESQIAGLRA